MPAKAAALDLDPSTRFLFSVLKHCEQIKPDWDAVAKENSIAYARNAAGRFRNIVKQNEFKFENGTITEDDDNHGNNATASLSTPTSAPVKATKTKQLKTPTSNGKKRKGTADGATAGTSNKKVKKNAFLTPETVSEDEDDDVVAKNEDVEEEKLKIATPTSDVDGEMCDGLLEGEAE